MSELYNKEKFKQLTHYFIDKCGHLESFGKTVLVKLLYFADFDHYEITENLFTGETYIKKDHGPFPSDIDEILDELLKEGKITRRDRVYHEYDQINYVSNIQPDISSFDDSERTIIESVLYRYGDKNATQLSDISHEDIPWETAEDFGILDYEMVFYRNPLTSVRDYSDD